MSKLNLTIVEVENGYLIHNHDHSNRVAGTASPVWIARNYADLSGTVIQLAVEADEEEDDGATTSGS